MSKESMLYRASVRAKASRETRDSIDSLQKQAITI
ncbi:MAG: hypothetical protein RL387_636 [Bacteroidota bacterium]|jgi:hypothetical protein